MIKLEKMSVKQPELDLIAEWRNESLIGLRSNDLTALGVSQERWVNSLSASERYYFIYKIYETHTEFVGYCGLDKIDPINRTAEMGLLIGSYYHKNGFGTEAVKQLLKMAFEDFNLNCIFIEVISSTMPRTWDFWLKQGFIYEGSLRDRHFKNNRYCESRIGSILKLDWKKQRENNLLEKMQ